MPQIIPTAEPFLFPGSRAGCLLIHGLREAKITDLVKSLARFVARKPKTDRAPAGAPVPPQPEATI